MSELFPRVEIKRENGAFTPVHIYGIAHGTALKGTQMRSEVGKALGEEGKNFGKNDYLIMEGTDERVLKAAAKAAGAKIRTARNFVRETIRPYVPQISSAEEIEHFEMLRISRIDPSVSVERKFIQVVQQGIREHLEKVALVTGRTSASPEEILKAKKDIIEELVKRGVDRQIAEMQVESKTTFRSLLMARAAYHRAYATGLPVRLFAGFAHTGEIAEFLSDEKKVDEYVATLPEPLRKLYEHYENHGWGVVSLFEKHSYKFEPRFHSEFFRWLALEHAKALHGKEPEAIINIADFRRMINRR